MISEEQWVVASKNQASCEMDQDTVILDLKEGEYFELNEVGGRIWALLQEPRTVGDIHSALLAEYEVPAEELWQDLSEILEEMAGKGLVDLTEQAPA